MLDAQGRGRMHGGKLPGAPRGNRHAWKHGRYSGEATRRRAPMATSGTSTIRFRSGEGAEGG